MLTTIRGAQVRVAFATRGTPSRLREVTVYDGDTNTGISFDRFVPFMLCVAVGLQNDGHAVDAVFAVAQQLYTMRCRGKTEAECWHAKQVFFTRANIREKCYKASVAKYMLTEIGTVMASDAVTDGQRNAAIEALQATYAKLLKRDNRGVTNAKS